MDLPAVPRFLRTPYLDSVSPPPVAHRVVSQDVPPPDRRALLLSIVLYGVTMALVLSLAWVQTLGSIASAGTP